MTPERIIGWCVAIILVVLACLFLLEALERV